MRNPPYSFNFGLRMLLLLHAFISRFVAYILSFGLRIIIIIVACPQSLSCCIYTALVSLLFGTVIPTSFNILMEMFLYTFI